MSIVKIGIMVEVYRYYGGEVDAQTHQELLRHAGQRVVQPLRQPPDGRRRRRLVPAPGRKRSRRRCAAWG